MHRRSPLRARRERHLLLGRRTGYWGGGTLAFAIAAVKASAVSVERSRAQIPFGAGQRHVWRRAATRHAWAEVRRQLAAGNASKAALASFAFSDAATPILMPEQGRHGAHERHQPGTLGHAGLMRGRRVIWIWRHCCAGR